MMRQENTEAEIASILNRIYTKNRFFALLELNFLRKHREN